MPVQYVQPILVQPAAEQKAPANIPFEKMTLDEKIDFTGRQVEKTKRRLKWLGCFFGLVAVGALGNACHSFHKSRDWASFIAQTGKLPWPSHHNKTEDAFNQAAHAQPTDYEFQLYDLLVKVSLLIFVYGVILMSFACRSKRLSRAKKAPKLAHCAFRRGIIGLVFFALVHCGMRRQFAHMADIVDQIDADKNLTSPINVTSVEHINGHRQLRAGHHHHEKPPMFEDMDEAWDGMRAFKGFADDVPQKGERVEGAVIDDDDFEPAAPEPSAVEAWATRENIYKMFAPKLWKYAREDSDETPEDDSDEQTEVPENKMRRGGCCPVMVVLYIAMFAHLYLCKSLQKRLAALELYQRAKQIMQADEANLENGSSLYDNSTLSSIAVVEPEIEEPCSTNIQDKACDFDYSLEEPKQPAGTSFSLNFDRNHISINVQPPTSSGSIKSQNQMA